MKKNIFLSFGKIHVVSLFVIFLLPIFIALFFSTNVRRLKYKTTSKILNDNCKFLEKNLINKKNKDYQCKKLVKYNTYKENLNNHDTFGNKTICGYWIKKNKIIYYTGSPGKNRKMETNVMSGRKPVVKGDDIFIYCKEISIKEDEKIAE